MEHRFKIIENTFKYLVLFIYMIVYKLLFIFIRSTRIQNVHVYFSPMEYMVRVRSKQLLLESVWKY